MTWEAAGRRPAEALKHTFENTEKHFFMMLDHSITQKMGLQMQMQVRGRERERRRESGREEGEGMYCT